MVGDCPCCGDTRPWMACGGSNALPPPWELLCQDMTFADVECLRESAISGGEGDEAKSG